MDNLRTVAFPEAGEGVELSFRNRDILVLRKKYGENYLQAVELGLQRLDMEVMEICLKVGGKKDGKPYEISIDALDSISMEKTSDRILDAYTLSANGRTFKEQIAWLQEQAAKNLGANEDPKPALEGSSAGSNEPPLGPVL